MSARTASCPNCGAEIVFRWSGAIQTTCPACRSILVRHDVNLEKVGIVADVPESMSGIQLGTEGSFKKQPFTVIGRIVYKYESGHWSEWHIRFGDDTSGWLSDAQAELAMTRAIEQKVHRGIALGDGVRIGEQIYTATTVTRAAYAGVEGELPFEYWDKEEIRFVDLRGPGDTFATIDESEDPPMVFIGEFEDASELRLRNLRETAPAAEPKSKGLNCPSCGAAITLRTGDLAQSVACGSCGSIISTQDENYRILQKHKLKMSGVVPQIPLGRTGQFKGKRWTVIGYQIRGITVEEVNYDWREYLLWNPEAGFRYLTEYEGHWNDVQTAKGLPVEVHGGAQPEYEYLGTRFKHFQRAKATTRFVLGEFPWMVQVGDEVWNDDFVAPPVMLSREATANEITWSVGTYTAPSTIKDAFKLESDMPSPRGVFANQPNPTRGAGLGKLFGFFAAALFVLYLLRVMTARNDPAFDGAFRFDPATGDTAAFVTRVFEIKGHASNVAVRIDTDLENDDAWFNVALLPEAGGKGYELGRDVSYYFGYDSDGRWSEGSQSDRVMMSGVEPGRYYLRIEPEHAGLKPVIYTVGVRRDVPRIWPFLVAFLVLAVVPVFGLIAKSAFESQRWAESDYAPVSSDDDEE